MSRLLTVNRGTAYFLRAMERLDDADLSAPSRLPGWSRRHVLAHVGYNARALTRLARWARTGVEEPMYASPEERAREIEDGASLSPVALRRLVEHSAIHLRVEWRDLTPEQWANPVRTATGRVVPAADTVWLRTREVWVHAIDLAGRESFTDLPGPVLRGLMDDVRTTWQQRGVTPEGPTPSDDLPEQVAWALGRHTVAGRAPAPHWI